MQRELFLKVSGRVQGVFFRQNCQKQAQALKLTGYAKNLYDQTVEVVAQGDEAKLREFLNFIKMGPGYAVIEKVEEQWRTIANALPDFQKF